MCNQLIFSQTIEEELDDVEQLAKQFLKDMAWFVKQGSSKRSNSEETRSSYLQLLLEETMKDGFDIPRDKTRKERLGVFLMTQEPHQRFLEFVQNVQDKSRQLGLTDKHIISIVERGAHPFTSSLIMMTQEGDISDIVELILSAENTDPTIIVVDTTNNVARVVADLRTKPPNTERFDDITQYCKKDNNATNSPGLRSWNQTRSDSSVGHTATDLYPPPAYTRCPRFLNQLTRSSDHVNTAYSQPSSQRSRMNRRRTCGNCGNFTCPRLSYRPDLCIAYGKTCGFCKKLNHFTKVCRSKQNMYLLGGMGQPCSNFNARQFYRLSTRRF